MKILEVLNEFRISCPSCKLEPFLGELINRTFYLKNSNINKPDYLIQRINPEYIRNASQMMPGIGRLTNEIYQTDASKNRAIGPVLTKEGSNSYYRDSEGVYWRMYYLLSRKELAEIHEIDEVGFAWAKSLGKFILSMDELPVNGYAEHPELSSNHTESLEEQEYKYVLKLNRQMEAMHRIWAEDQLMSSAIARVKGDKNAESKAVVKESSHLIKELYKSRSQVSTIY